MNGLTRLILGTLLLIAGLAVSAVASLLLCYGIPGLLHYLTVPLDLYVLDHVPEALNVPLIVTAAAATSGSLVLLVALAVRRGRLPG